jgi:hypothetical protein
MVSSVHCVGLVQPLIISTRLIIGGDIVIGVPSKYWGTRPLRPIGTDTPADAHILATGNYTVKPP